MRAWPVFLSLLALLCLIPGCGAQEKISMQGTLIYERGNKLHAFDLATRIPKPLVDWPKLRSFLEVVDNDTLLIGSEGLAEPSRLALLTLSSLEVKDLRRGTEPLYMPRHRKFFFIQGSRETGPRLFLADLDHPEAEAREIAPDEGVISSDPIVRVSDDEIVFRKYQGEEDIPLYRYNLVTEHLERLPEWTFGKCIPCAWRSASSQLICETYGNNGYYLVSLDGSRVEPIDLPKGYLLLLAYSEKQDVLLMNKPTMGWLDGTFMLERYDLWAYSFKTKRRERVAEGIAPGVGGLVWLE
ncbi:hypothetical protein [Nitrosovibrio sp. Nv17]|uniref:hypothetical protein n=1 Tax=Nitrosovibrio sp. Nv17 TaxID=1855339 RepID=UPI0011609AD3|nr:hypothetical protein [Nitrosovibrio sp. Nv17]